MDTRIVQHNIGIQTSKFFSVYNSIAWGLSKHHFKTFITFLTLFRFSYNRHRSNRLTKTFLMVPVTSKMD